MRPHYSPTWLAMRVPAKNVSTPEITDRVPPEVMHAELRCSGSAVGALPPAGCGKTADRRPPTRECLGVTAYGNPRA